MVSELIELSSVIGDIYDAAVEPTLWQQALASICAYVGGASAVLAWHDSATVTSEAIHLFNADLHYNQLYFDKYLPMNPMFPAGTFVDTGVVATSDDIMPRSELIGTRFYKEWLRPQGIEDALSVNLEKGVARSSFVNIRTEVRVTQAMRRRMAMIVPHLERAVLISRLFDRSAATEHALGRALDHVAAAVFLVASDGTISFTNDRAKVMLDDATLVRNSNGVLRAVCPKDNRSLSEIFAAAARGDSSLGIRGVAMPLSDTSSDAWFAHVLPLTSGKRQEAGDTGRAVAALFIRKAGPNGPLPLEAIAKRYNLLPSEIRVLNALARVQGVKALASHLGISQATVKTHLHNLFRKTGTRRQSELVKLVAGLA